MLSLTSDENFVEIPAFVDAKLTLRDTVFLLTYSNFRRMRLESEGFEVLTTARYEDIISSTSNELTESFPFEILNLDFLSQDPTAHDGRVEREIESIEITFKLENERQSGALRGFILIYTTLIDEKTIDLRGLVTKLNSHSVDGWSGMNPSHYPNAATTLDQKLSSLEKLVKDMAAKYGYTVINYYQTSPDALCSVILGVR
jgi:hypothetical protein